MDGGARAGEVPAGEGEMQSRRRVADQQVRSRGHAERGGQQSHQGKHKQGASGAQPRNKEEGSEYQMKRKQAEGKCQQYADEVQRLQKQRCECKRKCKGAWSDTTHGSHGMRCEVEYKRFLSLREKYLTDDHHSRPNSGSFRAKAWCILEFMCGVAVLSTVWAALGVAVGGLCECKQAVLDVVAPRFPGARVAVDARSDQWRHWDLDCQAEVVTGGPPCNPYSSAGTQTGERHEDADHICTLADAAEQHQARWVMLENVCELVTKFREWFGSIIQYYRRKELLIISTETLNHQELGGKTRRSRVWPVFEKAAVSALLPPWSGGIVEKPAGRIRDALCDTSDISSNARLSGVFKKHEVPVAGRGGVICVGDLWMGGPSSGVHRGCHVRLVADEGANVVVTHKGKDVHLRACSAEFVVISVTQHKVQLLYDDRDRPVRFWRRRDRVFSVCWSRSPVYSIDAPGPTIRSMRVPPAENGFLILDSRKRVGFVRAVNGLEQWRLHNGCCELAQELLQADFTCEQLGELAGSSIPREMCEDQVRKLKSRVDQTHEIEQLQVMTGVPWQHCDAPSVSDWWDSRTQLAIVDWGSTPRLLASESLRHIPGRCVTKAGSAEARVEQARGWAAALVRDTRCHFLAAEKVDQGCDCKLVVVLTDACELGSGMGWFSAQQLQEGSSPLVETMMVAVARVLSFQGLPHQLGPLQIAQRKQVITRPGQELVESGAWRAGKTPVRQLKPCTRGEVQTGEWYKALPALDGHQEELRCRIKQVEPDHPAYDWLQETVDRMQPLDVSDFASQLLEQRTVFSERDAVALEMPVEYEPPRTDWLPSKRQKQRRSDFRPTGLHDLVTAEGRRKIDRWVEGALNDLKRMKSLGRAAGRQFNEVLVLTQRDLYPEARGVIWDLRRGEHGEVVPLDFQAPLETHLNLDYLQWQCDHGYLKNYPDQELISQLMLGVSYKDDLDLQIVLLPHLISFADGCEQIQTEVEKYVEHGWYSLHRLLPYVPFRNIPRGSTPKATGEARPTSEAGAPRKPKRDREGNPVVPQNEAIKQAVWHKEWKPSVAMMMEALCVLVAIAQCAGEPIFFFSDDMAKCFNQLRLRPEQYWAANTFLSTSGGQALWAAEYVVPFGIQCASNVAQAWAHLITHLVRSTMDAMERASKESSATVVGIVGARWREHRDARQCRLYFSEQFTDDSAAAVVGVDRTIRYLMSWFEVISRFNIMMAPPRKRQLGCRLIWIGAVFLAIGMVTTQLQKRVRAMAELKLLLAGRLVRSALQKLVGLLQHLAHVFALKPNMTAALYGGLDCDSDGALMHPDEKVKPSSNMCSSAGRWMQFLKSSAGSSLKHFSSESSPLTRLSVVISWHSDAASEADLSVNEDGVGIGLGGYACGYWWNWPLTREAAELHITSLEAIAFAVNFFVFPQLFGDLVSQDCRLLLHCDALSSVLAITFERSKSKMISFIFKELGRLQAFCNLEQHAATTHEAGPGNVLADAASRAKLQVLQDYAAQMRMKSIRRHLSRDARQFILRAVQYARTLSAVEQDLSITQCNNADSASNPVRMVTDDGCVVGLASMGSADSATAGGAVRMVADVDDLCQHGPRESGHVAPLMANRMVSAEGQVLQATSDAGEGVESGVTEMVQQRGKRPIRVVSGLQPSQQPRCGYQGETASHLTAKERRRQALVKVAEAAARDIAVSLALDVSLVSVNVQEMMASIFKSILSTVPAGTADKDGRDWELWSNVMAELGVPAWRGDIAAHRGHDVTGYWREVVFQAIAYFRVLKQTKPRQRRLDANGNVIAAKPESATVVKSVRRIHGYFGVQMAHSKVYASILKSATITFIENHGLSALMPRRKAPFTNGELRSMLLVPVGTQLASVVVGMSRAWRSVEMLVHVLAQSGFRLADALRMNRDAVHFDFKNSAFPFADVDMLLQLQSTDYALLTPQRTKSDPLGSYWSPHPVYLSCSTSGHLQAGRVMYQYDVDFPVSLDRRAAEPLFAGDAGNRMTRQQLEAVLKAWLQLVGMDHETHSWHSFRVHLAVALKSAGADNARIKAMVRWVSDSSLNIYARDNKHVYADWLRRAQQADVSSVYVHSLPEFDEDAHYARLRQILDAGLLE